MCTKRKRLIPSQPHGRRSRHLQHLHGKNFGSSFCWITTKLNYSFKLTTQVGRWFICKIQPSPFHKSVKPYYKNDNPISHIQIFNQVKAFRAYSIYLLQKLLKDPFTSKQRIIEGTLKACVYLQRTHSSTESSNNSIHFKKVSQQLPSSKEIKAKSKSFLGNFFFKWYFVSPDSKTCPLTKLVDAPGYHKQTLISTGIWKSRDC